MTGRLPNALSCGDADVVRPGGDRDTDPDRPGGEERREEHLGEQLGASEDRRGHARLGEELDQATKKAKTP